MHSTQALYIVQFLESICLGRARSQLLEQRKEEYKNIKSIWPVNKCMNEGDELRTGSYCGIDLSRLSRTEIIKNGAKFTGDPPPNSFSLLKWSLFSLRTVCLQYNNGSQHWDFWDCKAAHRTQHTTLREIDICLDWGLRVSHIFFCVSCCGAF